ncbi:MAG: osmotically inducible protein C [Acinetobacter sp.]|nr:osmotically inducible protein C [Acinetobacter sp.]
MREIASAHVKATGVPYAQEIQTGNHQLAADEPTSAGGQDAGPSPYGLVLSGLGACTTMTLRMYADKKGWDLGHLSVDLTLLKDREGNTHIQRVLHSSAQLSEEQWLRLLDIASKTPVTKTLATGATITTTQAST